MVSSSVVCSILGSRWCQFGNLVRRTPSRRVGRRLQLQIHGEQRASSCCCGDIEAIRLSLNPRQAARFGIVDQSASVASRLLNEAVAAGALAIQDRTKPSVLAVGG